MNHVSGCFDLIVGFGYGAERMDLSCQQVALLIGGVYVVWIAFARLP